MTSRDSQTLSLSKREMAKWIERGGAVHYAYRLYQLKITIAHALFIMSDEPEMGWRYQEDVIREMVRLER